MSVAILAPGSRTRRFSKRLTQVVVTLFGLLLLTFFIGRVMPVDPVLAIVGPDADHSTYQQVYHQAWDSTGRCWLSSVFTSITCCTAIWAMPC